MNEFDGGRGAGIASWVELERGQLRRNQIDRASHVAKTGLCRHRKLQRIIQPRIEERPLAVHFEVGDERVPMRDASPSGPRVKIHASQAKRRRQERGRRSAAGSESLAVEAQLRVEFPRSPAVQDGTNGGLIDAEEISDGLQIGISGASHLTQSVARQKR